MKLLTALAGLLLFAVPLSAETYSWVDDNGTYNFTEDYSRVPQKYRKNVGTRGNMDGRPAADSRTSVPDSRVPAAAPQKGKEDVKQAADDNGLFGGKKPEAWQQEMRPLYAEVKRLEQLLVELESLIKNPVGISKSRFDGLPQEFRDTQKQYGQTLKRYNELNDEANKTGLPTEFRK
ncbi:MAG: DUF4124 domain-containing protein [Geobacteraceae bacterium]|nr:DUF4124 domain-containing protein [Geobacteraceae bacterium]